MEMVNVCWQCGDIGFKDALVYCAKCKSAPRHSYCMDEVPEDLTAEISWLCEDCRIKPRNSISPKTSVRRLGHGSGRATIGQNGPREEIGSINNHLVNPRVEDPVSNIRIDSGVSMDSHVSLGIKKKTLNCVSDGASARVKSSSCFKANENRTIKSRNVKKLMLCHKDKLNKSHSLVDAQCTKNQLAAKKSPDNFLEASNMQIVEGTSNHVINGLDIGRSSFCGLQEDEIQEFGRWKLKGRRAKRKRLILPSKYSFDNFHPHVDGKGTNSFAVKSVSDTVRSSSLFKVSEDEIEECGNEKAERKSLLLPDKVKIDRSIHALDLQNTNIQFEVEISPVTSVEASDKQIIKQAMVFDINGFGAGRPSPHYGLKEDDMEESVKENSKRRLVLPSKEELDNFHPLGDGEGSNVSFAIKRIPHNEPFYREIIGQTTSSDTNTINVVKSSASFGRLIPPAKSQPVIDDESASGPFVVKGLAYATIEPFDNKSLKGSSICGTNASGAGPSASFELRLGQVEEQGKEKSMRKADIYCEVTAMRTVGGALTCDTLGTIRPSVCVELEKAEIDRYGKEKPESRRLIPKTEADLNSLHLVMDSRGANIKLSGTRLSKTSVAASNGQTAERTDMKNQIKLPCEQQTLDSVPMVSHVWSGSFNINEGEFVPLRAHLSSRACEKVCNLARKLPVVLHMQKLPRLVAWPNSFKVSSPTDDNIALYFSPESIRVEGVLDELVDDIINNDLILRFQFDEVELLVFSSFVLPQDHQRICGKYYLWGVFKPRYARVCSVPAGFRTAPNQIVEGIQVNNSTKPAGRCQVDHVKILLKDTAQGSNDFTSHQSLIQPKEEIVRATSGSIVSYDEENFQGRSRIRSYAQHFGQSEEELHDCKREFPPATHGCSIHKNCELKEAADERIEGAPMVSPRGRSKNFKGDDERQLESKKSSASEGEILDSDSSGATNPVAVQQSLLKQPDEVEMLKKFPKILSDIDEGEVCDDGCFDDSRPTCLELFPVRVENMGTAFRFRTAKEGNELK